MENIYDALDVFKKKSREYANSVVDRRTFDMTKYILLFEECDNEEITFLDEEMLSNNMMKICENLHKMHGCKEYSKLMKKFLEFGKLVSEFNKLNKVPENVFDSEFDELSAILDMKIIYTLIELKVAVKLDLDDIGDLDVVKYCKSILNDVNNDKYATLSIEEHFDEENIAYSLYKVKHKK